MSKTRPAAPARSASLDATGSWENVIEDWIDDLTTRVKPRTVKNYADRIRIIQHWAVEAGIPLPEFRARHLSKFLAGRVGQVKDITRRQDAITIRVLLKWAARNGYIDADPLAGYQVPKADQPYVKCPSDEEIRLLLGAMQQRWKPGENAAARYVYEPGRVFYSKRNYAIIAGLIETACRIGEMLALRMEDYQPDQAQIAIRSAKGGKPRILPISSTWRAAVDSYLRKRPKCSCDRLFVSAFGEPLNVHAFGKCFKGYLEFAGLSGFTLHGLRHYALTRLAQTNLMAAAHIAGHADLKTTRGYLHASADFVRQVHTEAAPLARILVNVKAEQAKRKKLV